MQGKRIKVSVFSNYQMVWESLKFLIESNKDLVVTGTFLVDEKLSGALEIDQSEVAVIELSDGRRIDIISELLRKKPSLRIVVILAGNDLESQAAALKLGAVGIVHREHGYKLLIEAIRQTYKGETWLNQALLNKILERGKLPEKQRAKQVSQSQTTALTAREIEVVKMIGEGMKNKSIAESMSITEATVRHHLSSIYGKLGVTDRLNLVILSYRTGLLKPPDAFGDVGTPDF